jgi:hypothetical protein
MNQLFRALVVLIFVLHFKKGFFESLDLLHRQIFSKIVTKGLLSTWNTIVNVTVRYMYKTASLFLFNSTDTLVILHSEELICFHYLKMKGTAGIAAMIVNIIINTEPNA